MRTVSLCHPWRLLLILIIPLAASAQTDPENPPIQLLEWFAAPAPMIELGELVDVAVNEHNQIYVADVENDRIVKYGSDGTPLLQWGEYGYGPGEFSNLRALAVHEATGEVYVAEERRIQVFTPEGAFLREWAGPELSAMGMDVDAGGTCYVVFLEGYVWKCTSQGVTIDTWTGANGSFDQPHDVAVDSEGRIYVADRYNRRVVIFDNVGLYLGQWDSTWIHDIREVTSLAIDDQDNVYVGDDHTCPKIDKNGNVLSRLELEFPPTGLDVFGSGTLYVANEMSRHIEKWGYAPPLTAIDDVTGDQGRWVRLSWNRCELDRLDLPAVVTGYGVYRRRDAMAAPLSQTFRPDAGAKGLEGWDVIATVPARGDSTYQLVAPTLADSTGTGGIAWSVFVVSAFAADGSFWDSPPDSGYSVDNLPPPVLGAPMVIENPGLYELDVSWQASTAPDLGHYAVYRGATSGFLPASSLDSYATTTAPYFTDDAVASGETWYYRVGVFDDAETFSGYSAAAGAQVVSTTPLPQRPGWDLAQNVPNPFNPRTTIDFELPEAARVRLDVYDLTGRHIRTLLSWERVEAGHRSVVWEGCDNTGQAVAAGVYLYRLKAGAVSETKRMTLVK